MRHRDETAKCSCLWQFPECTRERCPLASQALTAPIEVDLSAYAQALSSTDSQVLPDGVLKLEQALFDYNSVPIVTGDCSGSVDDPRLPALIKFGDAGKPLTTESLKSHSIAGDQSSDDKLISAVAQILTKNEKRVREVLIAFLREALASGNPEVVEQAKRGFVFAGGGRICKGTGINGRNQIGRIIPSMEAKFILAVKPDPDKRTGTKCYRVYEDAEILGRLRTNGYTHYRVVGGGGIKLVKAEEVDRKGPTHESSK